MVKYLIFILSPALVAQSQGMTLREAIRRAWDRQPDLLAGEAQVDQAHAEAAAARAARLPTLQAEAGWRRTDEPLMAFGTKLDEGRLTAVDFAPARLNAPDPISGLGASVTLRQPIYAGGRIEAGIAAARAMASAADSRQARRRQETAAAVVQAYFGRETAAQGVIYAEDAVRHAQAMESYITARVTQGLMLKADALRARAFRAQTEADLALARQRETEVKNALALLIGGSVPDLLSTPLTPAPRVAPRVVEPPGERPDLKAARWEVEAASQTAKAEGGSLKPELGVELGWGTARPSFGSNGATWTDISVGARWTFSFAQTRKAQAARAGARAAKESLRWQQAVADQERANATAALDAAQARVKAAEESLDAAKEGRRLSEARFLAGLLPLTDRLDAETRLAGARALNLSSLLELRTAEARQALADGRPVEGVR